MSKKIISSAILFLILYSVNGQVTFNPSSFTAQDSVTLVVDVSGTPMAGQTEAFIWIFSNVSGGGKDGFTNTSWTSSPNTAKMTNVGTNKWQFGFIATTMFGQSPGELKDFGFLVKAKDGSKQTPDYKPYKFDPLVFTPTKLRIFPAKVDTNDVVTVNFDPSLGTTVDEQRMSPASATITAFDETGAQAGNPLTITIEKNMGTTIWSGAFLPNVSFAAGSGHLLKKFHYKFNGTLLDVNGNPVTVSTDEAEVFFISMK